MSTETINFSSSKKAIYQYMLLSTLFFSNEALFNNDPCFAGQKEKRIERDSDEKERPSNKKPKIEAKKTLSKKSPSYSKKESEEELQEESSSESYERSEETERGVQEVRKGKFKLTKRPEFQLYIKTRDGYIADTYEPYDTRLPDYRQVKKIKDIVIRLDGETGILKERTEKLKTRQENALAVLSGRKYKNIENSVESEETSDNESSSSESPQTMKKGKKQLHPKKKNGSSRYQN
jgi:hypothetical protein